MRRVIERLFSTIINASLAMMLSVIRVLAMNYLRTRAATALFGARWTMYSSASSSASAMLWSDRVGCAPPLTTEPGEGASDKGREGAAARGIAGRAGAGGVSTAASAAGVGAGGAFRMSSAIARTFAACRDGGNVRIAA